MNDLNIRLACLADEAAVRELSSHIWEGEDYIPETFADWVADPVGRFYLVLDGTRLAGFGKLSRLTAGEWWLEGLRVHPDFRGRGVARVLHDYAVALADEIGAGVLRFATASTNQATHHLATSTGFALVSRYLLARGPALPAFSPPPLQRVKIAETAAAAAWLAQTDVRQWTADLYEDGWQWFSLLPSLPRLVAAERVYWWRGNAGLTITDTTHDPEEPERAWMNLAVTRHEADMPALLADLRRLTACLGKETMHGKPPATPLMHEWLDAAGWSLSDDIEMFVFARPLPNAAATTSTSGV